MAISRDTYLRLLAAVASATTTVAVDIAAASPGPLKNQLLEMESSLGEINASATSALNLDELADLQAQVVVLQARITALGG